MTKTTNVIAAHDYCWVCGKDYDAMTQAERDAHGTLGEGVIRACNGEEATLYRVVKGATPTDADLCIFATNFEDAVEAFYDDMCERERAMPPEVEVDAVDERLTHVTVHDNLGAHVYQVIEEGDEEILDLEV